jgi:hypothetical protein
MKKGPGPGAPFRAATVSHPAAPQSGALSQRVVRVTGRTPLPSVRIANTSAAPPCRPVHGRSAPRARVPGARSARQAQVPRPDAEASAQDGPAPCRLGRHDALVLRDVTAGSAIRGSTGSWTVPNRCRRPARARPPRSGRPSIESSSTRQRGFRCSTNGWSISSRLASTTTSSIPTGASSPTRRGSADALHERAARPLYSRPPARTHGDPTRSQRRHG